MKILAQSTVAPRMPFIHMAYTAATTLIPQKSTLITGILFIILGMLLCFRLVLKKAKFLKIRKIDVTLASIQWCLVGVLVFACGMFSFHLSEKNGLNKYIHPRSVTNSKMRMFITYYLTGYWDKDKNKPTMNFDNYLADIKKNEDEKSYIKRASSR